MLQLQCLCFCSADAVSAGFAVSSAMKDNSQIYKVPPKLLPGKANSVSFVLDYTEQEFQNAEEMKDQMLKDNVLVMFGTNFKFADQSIMEIHVYGTREGKTLFHSRAHQMKLQMECDYGIYKRTAIKKEILLHDDRYVRACESIGYEFDEKGIDKVPEEGLANDFQDQIAPVIQENILQQERWSVLETEPKTFSVWKALNIIWICLPYLSPK